MKHFEYVVIGTVEVRLHADSELRGGWDEEFNNKQLKGVSKAIVKMLNEYGTPNLADYISTHNKAYGVVTDIYTDIKVDEVDKEVYEIYSETVVKSTKELNEEQKEDLLHYIAGQFSDGYGEGLEQQYFSSGSYWETIYVWDEEIGDDVVYDDHVYTSITLHLWQEENFKLFFLESESE